MTYTIILSQKNNTYIAQVKEWPDVVVEDHSRDEAIQRITSELRDYLTTQVELVPIEIPLSPSGKNPWLETFGAFKEDPTFEDLQNEIAAYRKEIDRSMGWSGE
jgi:predicted RNase H-like HicB family nuclease